MNVFIDSGGGTDPSFSNVLLLLHFNGANGSTTFTDSSSYARTLSLFGNAQVSTAQSKFGGASGLFDGADDYATAPGSDFAFGTSDFTVEFFVRVAGASDHADQHVLQSRAATNNGFLFQYNRTNQRISFITDTGGLGNLVTANGSILDNTWYHVAATRESNTWRLFLDGALIGTNTSSQSLTASNLYMSRRFANDGADHELNGNLDEMRITTGVARYTAAFTPPSAEFPNS